MINICIPVLNSYKELDRCIKSIRTNNDDANIWVIDNGGLLNPNIYPYINLHQVPFNMGVAASWNWFINNVSEYRIICNDDVEFSKNSIKTLVDSYDPNYLMFSSTIGGINSFSCFLLPQNIIDKIGLFDEKISPNYAYFEDNDYHRRMKLAGFDIKSVDAEIYHVGSSTLKAFSPYEEVKHHERFRLARDNYVKKWGGLPGEEQFEIPKGL